MGRGKKQQNKDSKKKASHVSKDVANAVTLNDKEEHFSSTQICHGVLSGQGEQKFVPTFSRKRATQLTNDMELSIPKAKIVPSFGKRGKCSTSKSEEESCSESSAQTDQPAVNELEECMEVKDDTSCTLHCKPSTQVEEEVSCGNSEDFPAGPPSTNDYIKQESSSKEEAFSSPSHLLSVLHKENSKNDDTPCHDPFPVSLAHSPEELEHSCNPKMPRSPKSEADYLNKLSEFCDLISDESDSDESGTCDRFSRFNSQLSHCTYMGQHSMSNTGFPASQPLPRSRVFRAPGLVLTQATITGSPLPGEEGTAGIGQSGLTCASQEPFGMDASSLSRNTDAFQSTETTVAGGDNELEQTATLASEDTNYIPTSQPQKSYCPSPSSEKTPLTPSSKLNEALHSMLSPINGSRISLEECNVSGLIDSATEFVPISSISVPEPPDANTPTDIIPQVLSPTQTTESLISPPSHLPDSDHNGCHSEHNKSFSLYGEIDGIFSKKGSESAPITKSSVGGKLESTEMLSESVEDTSILLTDDSLSNVADIPKAHSEPIAIGDGRPPMEDTATLYTPLSPCIDTKCDDVTSKEGTFDDSGVKLLQGILTELSLLNRFVMTCKREVETARRHRMSWLRTSKQRRL